MCPLLLVAHACASTQLNPSAFLSRMRELGVSFYAGVPDSCLAPFCAEVERFSLAPEEEEEEEVETPSLPAPRHVITANEGAAVATALGHHLATGAVPLVYMQNSGLGNAVNPLMSACHPEVYACPMLLLIGWRGAPGTHDEPQHAVQGRQTRLMLASMEVETYVLPTDDAAAYEVLREALAAALAGSCPVALLAAPKTFAGEKKVVVGGSASETSGAAVGVTREQAIEAVLRAVAPGDALVSTTGYASRELYELRETRGEGHDTDFLCVGCMGHALAIAQGIALAQPECDTQHHRCIPW